MPMPGPMAARPYPTLARPASSLPVRPAVAARTLRRAMLTCVLLCWLTKVVRNQVPGSVLRVHRLVDVDGGEDREDVRLQHGDEQLEAGEGDEPDERQPRETDLVEAAVVLDQQLVGHDAEDREQHVAGRHVGEKPPPRGRGA